jgi:hypothetical protein
MKTLIFTSLLFFAAAGINLKAQDDATLQSTPAHEKFGKTLNLGAGVGYYRYVGHTMPVGTVNFEFDIARNFTLAPFLGVYTYQNSYYWSNPNKDDSYRRYYYREIAVPVGVKGTYYFDQLFHANTRWDFYAAGSVGFVFRTVTWEADYYGDRHVYQTASPLYLDAHIGAEYHMTNHTGLFLDLSTGISTFGLAFHF